MGSRSTRTLPFEMKLPVVCCILAAALASLLARAAPSSHAEPQGVPGNPKQFSELAGYASQAYCANSRLHMQIGSGNLLFQHGNGDKSQRVNFWRSNSSGIVVSFEGTNGSSLDSIMRDVKELLVPVNHTLFTQVNQGSQVFDGFQSAYEKMSGMIESKVNEFMDKYHESRVTLTGHSLGSGLALLAMFHLDQSIRGGIHSAFLFAPPRVGNVEFANSVDRVFQGRYYYVVNGNDPIPHLPPRIQGYQHPSGQIWINPANSTNWKFYPGQENVHGANSVWYKALDISDHTGNYFHTNIGGASLPKCPAQIGSA